VNGVVIRSIDDYQVVPLEARVQAIQAAHIRKVVDTVHDLPNVLYEVASAAGVLTQRRQWTRNSRGLSATGWHSAGPRTRRGSS